MLDTGASELYLKNSEKLSVDIADVDFAVLSHAHYDHANGMQSFFKHNTKAPFYLRKGSSENCYEKLLIFYHYIGLPKGIIKEYDDRIIYADGNYQIADGISLIPHSTEGLDKIGKKVRLYTKSDRKYIPDDFAHEQSLVLDTDKGLVIFNSCSHAGAANIINEVQSAYPNKKLLAIIGGFHIYSSTEAEVRELARMIKATGIRYIYTGHCTGNRSYNILCDELGDMVHNLRVGLKIEL